MYRRSRGRRHRDGCRAACRHRFSDACRHRPAASGLAGGHPGGHRPHGGPHITISPPGAATPAITSAAAYELCLKGVAGCLPEPPTEILLALLTDTAYGTTSSAGLDTFPIKNTLVWAISWIGSSQCVFSGGGAAGPPGSSPTPTALRSQPLCDSITFVNATTGAFIYNVAYAHQ